MMADEFNFLWPKIENYIAEADTDLFPVRGQLELHSGSEKGSFGKEIFSESPFSRDSWDFR